MPVVHLTDRALVRACGPDAARFLHGVVTCNVLAMAVGEARYGALLFPQGKIVSDFFICRDGEESFLFDAPAGRADELLKRLSFHRLRAKVTFERADDLALAAAFGESADIPLGQAFEDPRLAALGLRLVLPRAAAAALPSNDAPYEAHRIGLGIPKGGVDFVYGEAFPHDADMDQLGGVDFRKGCYVGQEVVSRMEHRAIARNRLVEAVLSAPVEAGTPLMAGERNIGRISSVAGRMALASVRLDQATEARAEGVPITAGGAQVSLKAPAWAAFPLDWTRKDKPFATKPDGMKS